MPRPREFDEDETLDKAMHVFWRKGYAQTSVRDLVDATGVAHAGLYAAFTDKKTLFAKSLQRYVHGQNAKMFGPLEKNGAGFCEIKAFFATVAAGARLGRFKTGCFLAASASEFHDDAGEINRLLKSSHRRQIKAFRHALEQAEKNNALRNGLELDDAAAGLVASFYGLSALARAGASAATIESICRFATAQLN